MEKLHSYPLSKMPVYIATLYRDLAAGFDLMREFGQAITYVPVLNLHVVRCPKIANALLIEQTKYMSKAAGYKEVQLLLGNGLAMVEGRLWSDQRKAVMRLFHSNAMVNIRHVIETQFLAFRNRLLAETLKGADVTAWASDLSFSVIYEVLFGNTFLEHLEEFKNAFAIASSIAVKRAHHVYNFPRWVPTSVNKQERMAIATLDRLVNQIIEDTLLIADTSEKNAIIRRFLAQKEAGGISRRQLRDELLTMLFAGHETTTSAISWTLYELGKNPKIQSEARAQGYSDLYIDSIIWESMRLHSPIPVIARQPNKDVWYNSDITFKKGATYLILIGQIHRLEHIFPDPTAFRPDRFFDFDSINKPGELNYFPFGAGPRNCAGEALAMLELQIVIKNILEEFVIEPAADWPDPRPLISASLKSDIPIRCQFKLRHRADCKDN
jgi:cytochrome P450